MDYHIKKMAGDWQFLQTKYIMEYVDAPSAARCKGLAIMDAENRTGLFLKLSIQVVRSMVILMDC